MSLNYWAFDLFVQPPSITMLLAVFDGLAQPGKGKPKTD
jgi:hypothetical protein